MQIEGVVTAMISEYPFNLHGLKTESFHFKPESILKNEVLQIGKKNSKIWEGETNWMHDLFQCQAMLHSVHRKKYL